jgi:hypothetical protein
VEDLQQLELVVEIVLEPEDDLAVTLEGLQQIVAPGEFGMNLLEVAPVQGVGNEPRPHSAHLLEGQPAGHRTLVKGIAPGQQIAGEPAAAQQLRGHVAVRDVEFQRRSPLRGA